MNSLVSIIMPAFNCDKSIKNSIESVLKQTYLNWELLITNDKSTDNTKSIIFNYIKKDKRIKYYENHINKGAYFSRNKSISVAKGDYIAFLDSDDYWSPEKLEIQLNTMKKSGKLVSHSSYYRVNDNGKIINEIKANKTVSYKHMLSYNHIGNLTGIYNCKILGKFYQKDIGHEDYQMWLTILKNTDSIGIKKPLAYYKVTDNSLSSKKTKCIIWHYNILRSELKLSRLKSICYLSKYIFNAIQTRVNELK